MPRCPNNGPVERPDGVTDKEVEAGEDGQLGDLDTDGEADDTDDTSSITSSASSTASLQSMGGMPPNRKKSIPLSIRNLKRKHKKKRTKFSREFKQGDR